MSIAARVIVISKDSVFSIGIMGGLKAFPTVEMVVSVASQADAENKITRSKSTIIVVDVDSVEVDPALMLRMVKRFSNVLVVLTAEKERTARRLIAAGIRDFISKPTALNTANVQRFLTLILGRMGGLESSMQSTIGFKDMPKTVGPNNKIIAIAASTGGVEALEKVISELPTDVPPILLVQHMPSGFTSLFADRLNGMYPLNIKEAQTGDYLFRGQLLIAPAGSHMRLVERGGKLAVDCFLGSKLHGVIPSADVLFESVANIQRKNAIGVILTGMGADGGRGLMLMHNNGARTIGQNRETCVVYGMPKVAKDLGAVDFELPIDRIAAKILELV